LRNDGNNWKIVASQYGKRYAQPDRKNERGMWLDEPAVRALAIVLQRDILVVPSTAPIMYYPKQLRNYRMLGTNHTFDGSTEASIVCLDDTGEIFIPAIAFNSDTIVVCHNNSTTQGHFWCTQPVDQHDSMDWSHYQRTCPLRVRTLVCLQT
jgi:hypothetical protein